MWAEIRAGCEGGGYSCLHFDRPFPDYSWTVMIGYSGPLIRRATEGNGTRYSSISLWLLAHVALYTMVSTSDFLCVFCSKHRNRVVIHASSRSARTTNPHSDSSRQRSGFRVAIREEEGSHSPTVVFPRPLFVAVPRQSKAGGFRMYSSSIADIISYHASHLPHPWMSISPVYEGMQNEQKETSRKSPPRAS